MEKILHIPVVLSYKYSYIVMFTITKNLTECFPKKKDYFCIIIEIVCYIFI